MFVYHVVASPADIHLEFSADTVHKLLFFGLPQLDGGDDKKAVVDASIVRYLSVLLWYLNVA